MSLFAVKTTANREATVGNMIIERDLDEIYAALVPEQMTSYLIVEAESLSVVERVAEDVPHAIKVLEQKSSMSEIENFLDPISDVEGITEGDVVRLTGGPFSGETAKVDTVHGSKEKVTVQLYEAQVPIPVEVRGDQMRVLDSEERERVDQ